MQLIEMKVIIQGTPTPGGRIARAGAGVVP